MQTVDQQLQQANEALERKDFETAEHLCRAVLEHDQNPDALHILAQICEHQMLWEEGIRLLEKAQSIGGLAATNLMQRAVMHVKLAKDDPLAVPTGLKRAEALFQMAIEKDPSAHNSRSEYAAMLTRIGRAEEALDVLRPMLDQAKPQATILSAYAELAPKLNQTDTAIGYLESALCDGPLQPSHESRMLGALARLLDGEGDFDRAFEAMKCSNDLIYKEDEGPDFKESVDAIMDVFSSSKMARFHRSQNDSELPIFVVGLPRSGTSLVEQILASHPRITGGGEVKNLTRINNLLPNLTSGHHFPEAMNHLSPESIDRLAKEQIDYLTKLAKGADRVTSKQPTNFVYLGFIEILMGKARIINCLRNPLDTCLSLYFQSWDMPDYYIKKFESLAMLMHQYDRLMNHWRQVLHIPILDVVYEDLVADPQAKVSEMLEFLGLPWDEACMKFHQNDRIVYTASYDQVRQPIYSRSIDRWRNYATQLGPLRELLKI